MAQTRPTGCNLTVVQVQVVGFRLIRDAGHRRPAWTSLHNGQFTNFVTAITSP